ncbi:beta-mannosidase [Spirochaetia bacterium]|nr:beta-mannosidase [Spirochaetia bacterium]
MKESVLLNKGWEIKQIEPTKKIDPSTFTGGDGWLRANKFPAQVHDILYENRRIPEEWLVGWCQDVIWTDDFDWLYRCVFHAKSGVPAKLIFQGLDTIVEIYLNGKQIVAHDDFYVTEILDVTGLLEEENTLILHFHSVKGLLAAMELKPEWKGQMLKCKLIRKPVHDFIPEDVGGCEYQGSSPYFTPIGIYRDVCIVYPDESEIEVFDLRASLLQENGNGVVTLHLSGKGQADKISLRVSDDAGKEFITEAALTVKDGKFNSSLSITVDNPKLWWPRGMGHQFLYNAKVLLYKNGKPCDGFKKKVGFRRVENPSTLEFLVNGKRVRLWGGSMDPLQGYTHCWQPDRARRLFALVENANMNTLRIWGEGHPLPDSFYEEADERGILIWQEFFMSHGAFPDTPAYRTKLLTEARQLILRIRHHTSLLMWCGGNESIMGAEHDGKHMSGNEVLYEEFPRLLKELDPERYYHPSSPSGGAWANDPREGDYHTYNCVIEYPYQEYPNFTSECIRTAPPVMHSLRKFIKGDLWPAGYDGKFRHEDAFPFPDNWSERTCFRVRGEIKTGPYWEYYDADNAEQLSYRFAAAYSKDLRKELERIRMGSPNGDVPQSKRSKGLFSCKLLDTWPKIYCAVIDYFQEGFHPYYATVRGMQPLLVCFDRKDSIRLWLINDSGADFTGQVKLGIYNLVTENFIVKENIPVKMGQGESGIIRDIAQLIYFFSKDVVLYARLTDEKGNFVSESVDYVTEERRLKFPDAKLKAEIRGDGIYVSSDRFARCVEILGESDGNPFGWLFSDNYFDLMPGTERKIKITDGPDHGTISLKPHYSNKTVKVSYKK